MKDPPSIHPREQDRAGVLEATRHAPLASNEKSPARKVPVGAREGGMMNAAYLPTQKYANPSAAMRVGE